MGVQEEKELTWIMQYAPYHSTDVVKPTEEQYFGIVIMRVELFGSGRTERIENKEQAQVILKGLNELKYSAFLLSWSKERRVTLQSVRPAGELFFSHTLFRD